MHKQVKPIEHRWLLAILGGCGLLSCLLWSPVFIAFALKHDRLDREGINVTGQVIDHSEYQRPGKATVFSAKILYSVTGKNHYAWVSGEGANSRRLPQQASITVRYLPSEPEFSVVSAVDASSGPRPSWTLLYAAWSLSGGTLVGSYLLSKSKVKAAAG